MASALHLGRRHWLARLSLPSCIDHVLPVHVSPPLRHLDHLPSFSMLLCIFAICTRSIYTYLQHKIQAVSTSGHREGMTERSPAMMIALVKEVEAEAYGADGS